MTVNTCQKKTSRNLANGILSLIITILYLFIQIIYTMNSYYSNPRLLLNLLYLSFFIFITVFNFKSKCCECCD